MSAQNKTALVTGSTSGIGLATAKALAKRGVNIIVTGFGDESLIKTVLADLKGFNVRADYIPADLSKVADIDALWTNVMRLYQDGIDILINNAGIFKAHLIEQIPDSDWDHLLAVMLSAPFHLTKRCLPTMKKKGWGRIINTSSVSGLRGLAATTCYATAKHGLIGLTKSVALETASHGITCNAICPGPVQTTMIEAFWSELATATGSTADELKRGVLSSVPTGTLSEPEQVADLVEFLCLSAASSQMTGAAYSIDGGYTAK